MEATTCAQVVSGYGRWLAWLKLIGQLRSGEAAGERATRDRVRDYIDALHALDLADNSIAGRLQQLSQALRAIAPDGDWAWIHRASSRMYSRAVLVRDPVERMQPADQVIALGEDLMHAATHDRFRTECDRATLFRDGLMLALLVHRPYRLANLTSMTLGEHVSQIDGKWWIEFPEDQLKGDELSRSSWPGTIVEALEIYLETHRAVLLRGAGMKAEPTGALWISRQGRGMGCQAIAYQISGRTEEEFGRSINPHTFRHIASSTIAEVSSEDVLMVKGVLGHTSMNTSERRYNRARVIGATKSFQGTINTLRADAKRSR